MRATYQPYANVSAIPRKKLDQEIHVKPGNSFIHTEYMAKFGKSRSKTTHILKVTAKKIPRLMPSAQTDIF